ncbi:hypothetical protein BpHYR1_032786 [Brachionus plicatilis]|uniref:Uncharacterized protein n=1 Tax=Brachionus plicatilis TaxID=10195 RepID=A0A3M7STK8_BRAPC|nr:hypothetical protein BpHYR1_032786 [Brachionus plicatilis]
MRKKQLQQLIRARKNFFDRRGHFGCKNIKRPYVGKGCIIANPLLYKYYSVFSRLPLNLLVFLLDLQHKRKLVIIKINPLMFFFYLTYYIIQLCFVFAHRVNKFN